MLNTVFSANEGTSVNKTQLVDSIAAAADLSRAKAAAVLEVVFNQITEALIKDEKAILDPFCRFTLKKREARVGRNPRTGDDLQIPETNVVGFKPGKALKDAVNGKK